MKRLLTILFIAFSMGLFAQTGEIKPITCKALQTPNNATFYFNPPDTTLRVSMGTYGILEIAGAKRYQRKLKITTTGTSGASTLIDGTLNIPQYSGVSSGIVPDSLKEDKANKENTTVDNSTTKYPTVNLLKTYADTKEPVFSKNTAFNKNFGTTAGTVLEGRTFGTAANNNTSDFLLSSVNPYNSSVSFNSSTNNLSVVDAGGTKTANILVNTDLLINGFSGTINVTSNPVTFNWPVAYANTNYYLDIFPHYTETIEGKSVLIRNAVYDFTKTTTGFSLKLDTLAGVVEYRASRTINSETPANVVLQSDSITKFVTPKQLGDSLNTVVRTEVDPTIYAWAKSSTKPSYIASEVGAVPTTRTLTISGTTYDLSADRTWTVSGGTSTATSEIWTAKTGTYASATTFTFTGTDKDIGLLELSLLTCTDAAGTTRRIGYVKTATNSSGTITCNVVTNTDLASGDKDFKIAYNRKVTDYMRLVTIPGEQIADASYSQGMFYADIQSASYLLPVDLSVQKAAAGSGAALTVNIYKNTTALFSSAPDMTTNTVLRSQRPTTNTISAAETVSLRIMSSVGATNRAAGFQAKLYIVPQTIYTSF